ncbi:MAG: hypothetical protein AB8G15_12205 [Saprospiraceae bacterium]
MNIIPKTLNFLFSLALLLSLSCASKETTTPNPSEKAFDQLLYFGFALVDVGWDDPSDDPISKINYLDEVAAFTNIADILVVSPTDQIVDRLEAMDAVQVKAYLHLNEIFFEYADTDAPSGANYNLRADFKARWDLFVASNDLQNQKTLIQAFYVGEEPLWNGISFEELKAAADYLKASFPEVPTMLIEAHPIVDQLQIPASIDWVGFDRYFLKDPQTSTDYQRELNVLKSKFSREDQSLVLIMDAHFIDWAHGDFGGLTVNDMRQVATNYYQLAKAESQTVAIIGYFWPSGFDDPNAVGARHLPAEVKAEYERIGKSITRKN